MIKITYYIFMTLAILSFLTRIFICEFWIDDKKYNKPKNLYKWCEMSNYLGWMSLIFGAILLSIGKLKGLM